MAARKRRVAGVGGVAVDVSLNTALADQHIPVAAGRTGPDSEVLLALAQDLSHRGIGLTVGGKAAEGDAISALDELGNRVVQGVDFVHNENPHYTIFSMYGFYSLTSRDFQNYTLWFILCQSITRCAKGLWGTWRKVCIYSLPML